MQFGLAHKWSQLPGAITKSLLLASSWLFQKQLHVPDTEINYFFIFNFVCICIQIIFAFAYLLGKTILYSSPRDIKANPSPVGIFFPKHFYPSFTKIWINLSDHTKPVTLCHPVLSSVGNEQKAYTHTVLVIGLQQTKSTVSQDVCQFSFKKIRWRIWLE